MADIVRLTTAQAAALRRHEKYRRLHARLELVRLSARATIRLVDVMRPGLDPATPAGAAALAELSRRAARAYGLLERLGQAIDFTDRVARGALKRAALEGTA